jgi:hypothetical protein
MKNFTETEGALRGMHRASIIARERAARHGLKVPVWKEGQIVYLDARQDLELRKQAEESHVGPSGGSRDEI